MPVPSSFGGRSGEHVWVASHRGHIRLEPRFSDHAPLTFDHDFTP